MLQHKKFVKKTKQNKIVQVNSYVLSSTICTHVSLKHHTVFIEVPLCLQVSREHYLRDDIWSGTPLDPESDAAANKLSATAKHYLVVDTNVALSQVGHGDRASIPWALSRDPFNLILRLNLSVGPPQRWKKLFQECVCMEHRCLSGLCAVGV